MFRSWINPQGPSTPGRVSPWRRFTAPQLFVASFLALAVLGTLGLRLMPGLYVNARLGWLDAAFTAVSAVCVTGLVVVDTATYFTPAGQAFLLLLIQFGGLGMVTFTSLIILLIGRRLSLRQEALAGVPAEVAPHVRIERLARDVVVLTFAIEAIGALALYAVWAPALGWKEAAWPAVFHAVSAFCNAGFSTFSDSLIGFQRSPSTLLVVSGIVIMGGLGFLTLEELLLAWRARRRRQRRLRLSLHSRLVLATTAALLLGGWVLFALTEWSGTLASLPALHRVTNALFLSVTPRTAGFNNIDYAEATDGTNFLTILLMFVGGSPGSTAGGIKTTTMALVGLLAWSRFRGRRSTGLWHRSVPEETVERAVGLAAVAFAVATAGILMFTWTEGAAPRGAFLSHMFEAVSAFNTVGLSMGVTDNLSTAGRAFTILLMFVGRVGPLTFAAALAVAARVSGPDYRYAHEDVVVG